MTLTITHPKVNAITDWTQADLDSQIALGNFPPGTTLSQITLASDWNASHTISGTLDATSIGTGTVDNTEFGYLDGVTSNIQTQLNSKVSATRTISTTAPLTGGGDLSADRTLAIPKSTGSVDGYLAAADFTTFNAKENALTFSTGLTRSTNTITSNLSTGVSGGQSAIGGTASGENLTLSSTSNATKGKIIFGSASAYDEVNDRLGITIASPSSKIHIVTNALGVTQADTSGIIQKNNTAAALGAQQISPSTIWAGNGWSTTSSASMDVRYKAYTLPVQGTTNPTADWILTRSFNGGANTEALAINYSTFGTPALRLGGSILLGFGASQTQLFSGTSGYVFYNNGGSVSLGTASNIGEWALTPTSLTGSSATSGFSISRTWNTTGNPALYFGNVTNTASGGSSLLLQLQTSSQNTFRFFANSATIIFGTNNNLGIGCAAESSGAGSLTGGALRFLNTVTTTAGYAWWYQNVGGRTATSGTSGGINYTESYAPTSGTGIFNGVLISNTINQTGGANGITRSLYIAPTLTAAADFRAIEVTDGKIVFSKTITAAGTTGAQTINKTLGSVNFAAGATTLVVTNNQVSTTSIVQVQVEGTDATFTSARITLAAGSFTITANAAATAETKVNFIVFN